MAIRHTVLLDLFADDLKTDSQIDSTMSVKASKKRRIMIPLKCNVSVIFLPWVHDSTDLQKMEHSLAE
jgi:hypothetical protein